MIKARHFKIGIIPKAFANTIDSYLNSHMNSFGRAFILLSEVMNFSFQAATTNAGGALLQNGTWTGIIGMLNRSEIDFSPESLFLNEERNAAVHFSYPFDIGDLTFLTKKPQYESQIFAIFRTVALTVWMCVGICIVFNVVLYAIMIKRKYSLDKILLHVLAVLLRQQPILNSTTRSETLLILSWTLGAFFLSLCYNSVLLSFLSFPPTGGVKDLKSLANAVKNSEYNCMMMPGTSFPDMFANSENEYLRIIGRSMQNDPNSHIALEDFIQLKTRNLAFIGSRGDILFLNERFFISNSQFYVSPGSIAMKKDFCCKDEVNKNMMRISETGIFQKFERDRNFKIAIDKMPSDDDADVEAQRKLNITDISAAFLFLAFGHFISLLLLFVEIVIHRRKAIQKKGNRRRISSYPYN